MQSYWWKEGRLFTETHASIFKYEGNTTDEASDKSKTCSSCYERSYKWCVCYVLRNLLPTYVIGALIKKDILPKALWWIQATMMSMLCSSYHYLRLYNYNDEYDLLLREVKTFTGNTGADGITEEHRLLNSNLDSSAFFHRRDSLPLSGEVLVRWME